MTDLLQDNGDAGLVAFTKAVNARARRALRNPKFHADQQRLLQDTWAHYEAHAAGSSYAQPLGLLYLVLKAWNQQPDARTESIGVACSLYVLSCDLFDDVQDEDLAGKPHAAAGPAIATNSALALMFLAFDALRTAQELEPDVSRRLSYMEAFNRVSVLAVGCQHADLLGSLAACTPAEVTQRDEGKTSSVALFMECGALLAGCSPEQVERYRHMGLKLAGFAQIVDDVRDIYAKEVSPDLATGKLTYPLACFFEDAPEPQLREFARLRSELPESLPEIRTLLYEAGALDRCAAAVDALRMEFYEQMLALGNPHAAHRLLCRVIDGLAAALYDPEPVEHMQQFWRNSGPFAAAVERQVQAFCAEMGPQGAPPAPRLEAWPWPHFLFEPGVNVLHFPDVDQLADEVLPFHASVWGMPDCAAAGAFLERQLPFIVAHEMFHCWRHHAGLLSEDAWHEEYVANRLAVAFASEHAPEALQGALQAAAQLPVPAGNQEAVSRILESSSRYQAPQGYELDARSVAAVHAQMLLQFAAEPVRMSAEIAEWLGAVRGAEAA